MAIALQIVIGLIGMVLAGAILIGGMETSDNPLSMFGALAGIGAFLGSMFYMMGSGGFLVILAIHGAAIVLTVLAALVKPLWDRVGF